MVPGDHVGCSPRAQAVGRGVGTGQVSLTDRGLGQGGQRPAQEVLQIQVVRGPGRGLGLGPGVVEAAELEQRQRPDALDRATTHMSPAA